jgi:transcriptional regulator with XRE-family HTH domain
MTSIKERTKWAITYVVKNRNLSNKKVAEILKINENTIGSYRNMSADPKVEFIVKFCDQFEFDILWFTKGMGEPFAGARAIFPEICDQFPYTQNSLIKLDSGESGATYKTVGGEDMKESYAAVLRSGEELATGLSSNITSFLKSMAELCRYQVQEKIGSGKFTKLQARLDEIESRLDRIEKKSNSRY